MKFLTWAVVAAAAVLPACSCNSNNGKCTTDSNCTKGSLCCSGTCADPQTDRANCGTCGTACGTQNAASECVAAICHLTCQSGFGNCNGSPLDGCETKLSDTSANCGQCGHSCAGPHSQGICLNGQCASGACETGFKDCNTSRADGCETSVSASATDCGDCGKICQPKNTSGRCTNGTCQIGTCNPGFDNCNGLPGDGCEVDLSSDPNHCGDCTTVCDSNLKCVGGHCGSGGVLLYGGLEDLNSQIPTDAVTSYDVTTHVFVQLVTQGTGPGARYGHLAVWDAAANRLLVWGGFTAAGAADTSVHALDFNMTPPMWSTLLGVTGTPPITRGFMQYGFDQANRTLYLFGGSDVNQTPYTETWKFDAASLTWTQLASESPSRSFGFGAFEGGRLVIGLGIDPTSSTGVPGYAAYDPDAGWSDLPQAGEVPGFRLGVQALGDAAPLVFFGGYDPNSGLSDYRTFIGDENDGGMLLSTPNYPQAPPARAYAGSAAGGGRRYLFGGYLAALGEATYDLWSFDLDGGWTLENDGGMLVSTDAGIDPDAGFVVITHPGSVLPTMVAR